MPCSSCTVHLFYWEVGVSCHDNHENPALSPLCCHGPRGLVPGQKESTDCIKLARSLLCTCSSMSIIYRSMKSLSYSVMNDPEKDL